MSSSSPRRSTTTAGPAEGRGGSRSAAGRLGGGAGRLLALLPAGAAATAEGAWVAVWYAALAGSASGRSLGLLAFAAAAATGLAVARRLHGPGSGGSSRRPRLGARIATVALVLGAAALGFLAERSPGASGVDWLGGVAAGLARGEVHGLLLGLALWRGTRHADAERDDLVTAGLVGWGTPLLAVPWLIGGLRPAPGFAEAALLGTLTFVAAGLVAIGLTRLEALDRSVGLDWRRNRAWLVLLVSIVGGAALLAVPAALIVGASVAAIGAALAGPAVAVVDGAGRALGGVRDLIGFGRGLGGPGGIAEVGTAPSGGGGLPDLSLPGAVVGPAAVVFGLLLVVAAYRLYLRTRDGRPSPEPPPVLEEHRFRLPRPRLGLTRPGLGFDLHRRRPRRPRTATEAYLGLVERLGSGPIGRRPSESPTGHARRLRLEGSGSFRFDLLAADVALERFAGRRLSEGELRRALDRARDPRLDRARRAG